MAGFGWWTGCGCCQTCNCTTVSDDYSSDTSANYDLTGSWSVSGGTFGTTTASGALAIHKTTICPSGVGKISADLGGFANNNFYRLIGAYTDANNYLFAEIKITNAGFSQGELKVFDRTSGANTQLGSTFSGTVGTSFSLCWDGALVTAFSGGVITITNPSTRTGTRAGLGADVASGTATFDNFLILDRSVASCTTCNPCANCNEYTWPRQVQLDVVGTVSNGTCTACATVPTTFVCGFDVTSPCVYRKTFSPATTCSLGSVVASTNSGQRTASITFGGVSTTTWTETGHSNPYDCSASITGIPWVSDGASCNYSSTTLSWTPIA